ncbi:MAG: YbaK/EbsC family protein [Spirochaetaceae bacterium]|jgi:prolyl-tRNA editing enzyme YbaK/EbsC (Cys-tRNA(Pro) deacylase)|nr:YbaK/EbsC family protein [Spirochaetaceae bacterium]
MALEQVREYLQRWNREGDIKELTSSMATVADAARALGVSEARIAKSISLKKSAGAIVLVVAGDMKLDNRKFKGSFGFKATMLSPLEALAFTGHPVGGICPFGLPLGIEVFLDISLQRFETVFPACGSSNSAIELTIAQLQEYSGSSIWVDVCKAR